MGTIDPMLNYVVVCKVDLAAKTKTVEKIIRTDEEEEALEKIYPESLYSLASFSSTDPNDPAMGLKVGDTHDLGYDPFDEMNRDELEELEKEYPNGIK